MMASIGNDSNGRKRVLFLHPDGTRRTIRLGKVTTRQAEAFALKVDNLVGKLASGQSDPETERWVAGLDDLLHERLARAGLARSRGDTKRGLGEFIDDYIRRRVDVKPNTAIVYGRVRDHLVKYFTAGKPLREITRGDADNWRRHLIGLELSDNTVRRHCGIAKQFFQAAVRLELLTANPFDGMSCSVRGNEARLYFVTRAEAQAVLDACPDAEWRAMFALARFGGLRCPSEILALQWNDIDWAASRMRVPSPKTEHHKGHEARVVPLFPELRSHLEALLLDEATPDGAEFVITRYRNPAANLRTQLLRIITRAKLKAWPRLWQNLRSTRETELADRFPIHVVTAWIGNSQPVAREHYLQIRPEHFEAAIADSAAQNPAHYPHSDRVEPSQTVPSTAPVEVSGGEQNSRNEQRLETICNDSECFAKRLPRGGMGVGGLERIRDLLAFLHDFTPRGTLQ